MATTGSVLGLMHDWAGNPQPIRGSFLVENSRRTSRYGFSWLRPDLYRLEELEGDDPGSTIIRRDREVWSVHRGRVYHRREVAGSLTLLDNLFFASFGEAGARPPIVKGTTTVAGRTAALIVLGSPWRGHSDEIEVAVDLATGMVLQRVHLLAGKPTLRMEVEGFEIGAELPTDLFAMVLAPNVSIIELESKGAGFPVLEDLSRLLSFQVWVPSRPRDLSVMSVDTDFSTVMLVWVEHAREGRGIVVEATEGATAGKVHLDDPERNDGDDLTMFLSVNKQKSPPTYAVQLEKGGTPISLDVRGSREQAIASALGLIPLSAETPELVRR